jgi:TolA-binding protein
MKPSGLAASLIGWAALLLFDATGFAQVEAPIGRGRAAQPVPVARAVPVEEPTATPLPEIRRALPAAEAVETPSISEENSAPNSRESASVAEESESPEQRQINYANALFGRKLYDLAVPEYEKFLGLYPRSANRASAYFYMGECYRALGRTTAARTSFQSVLNDYAEGEFAGPSAYGVAEILFNQKDYAAALPLFHRAGAKIKASSLALSARYFEARCLENVNRKDEARDIYQQVSEAKDSNPYRDDSRLALAAIFLANGRKSEALKQYEALANGTQKASLKAEAMVRAGMIAVELQRSDKGKIDSAMTEKAAALLQKGRALPEVGRWKAIAAVGLLRLQYQAGEFARVIDDYERGQDQIPEDVRAEMMLLLGNSQRQLGHYKEAEDIYRQIVDKYPSRDEAKDAQYQRLISLYSANDAALGNAIDEFIKNNPTGERADQAKLLKAEALYKEHGYAAAAPLYTELRDSQLSPKLRAESAYKLGWCYVQTKEPEKTIEAFDLFLKNFPNNEQTPSALAQRALAYQELKKYDLALADLDALLARYPQVREREAALQQKALILGQLDNPKGMTDTFQQLLKEFPKSTVAAQATYYIGKAAFEAKKYEVAIDALDRARKLSSEQYEVPATLRIMSSYFYLKQRDALANEMNVFFEKNPNGKVPAEILEWLGVEFYNEKNYQAAEKYLGALSRSENLASAKPDVWFYLGDAQLKLNDSVGAETSFEKYLQSASDPAAKAKALLALGKAKIGAHKPDDAQKIAEEIMSLQPEGRVNAEARLLSGEVQLERQHFEEAGKAFMSVALLYDDPAITPRALEKAAKAYEKAGKNEEANRVVNELHQRYPDYAGG